MVLRADAALRTESPRSTQSVFAQHHTASGVRKLLPRALPASEVPGGGEAEQPKTTWASNTRGLRESNLELGNTASYLLL